MATISNLRWNSLANDLNEWKYVTQDALWLKGSHQSAMAHAEASQYLPVLEKKLKSHGYEGGPLKAVEIPARDDKAADFVLADSAFFEHNSQIVTWYGENESKRWTKLISERVDDWIKRLNSLKELVVSWVNASGQTDLAIESLPPAIMHEDFMVNHGVPQREMPVFKIIRGQSQLLLFRPNALWVVGANGRVDLISRHGAPMLLDISEPMSTEPQWQIFQSDRRNRVDFNYDTFLSLLN